LGIEESLAKCRNEVVPGYNIVMLASDPVCHAQLPSFNLRPLNEG
jgi:hypothetical protein